MYLLFDTKFLLVDILKISQVRNRENFAKLIDRSPRQVDQYFSKQDIPPLTKMKMKHALSKQGIELPENFVPGDSCANSWKMMAEFYSRHFSDIFPRSFDLLLELAEKDIKFLMAQGRCEEKFKFDRYKEYLLEEVFPFYGIDREMVGDVIKKAQSDSELESVKFDLYLESILFLLSFTEADFLSSHEEDPSSIVALHIPYSYTFGDSPVKLFFKLWLQSLGLDRKKMVEGRYEVDCLCGSEHCPLCDDSFEEGMSSDAIAKQFQRYFNEGKKPTWNIIEKWARELYPQAAVRMGKNIGVENYSIHMKFIFSGVLILDRLFNDGIGRYSADRLIQIMSRYEKHFDRHIQKMKKGVGIEPTPERIF